MASKNAFLQRYKKRQAARNKGSKPRASYETYPMFVPRDGINYEIMLLELDEFEFPEDFNPQNNPSDEGSIHARVHYFPKGLKGISGRMERYVFCPKSLDIKARCACCEAYWGTWQLRLKKMDENSDKFKALKESVKTYRATNQNWYRMLNLSVLKMKNKPDCFQVEGKLDASTEKCKACIVQDYCYRGQIGSEMWNMPINTEKEFEKVLLNIYGVEDEVSKPKEVEDAVTQFEDEEEQEKFEPYDGDYSDPSNAVIWGIKYSKENNRKTSIKVKKVGYSLPKVALKALETKFDSQSVVNAIFAETHTYQQMLEGIPESIQEIMVEYFEQEGLDWPDGVESDVSLADETIEYKECFADRKVFDVDKDSCVMCPLFNSCSGVIDGDVTKYDALMDLGFEEEAEKAKTKTKKNETKFLNKLKKKRETEVKEPEETEEDDDEFWGEADKEIEKENALERLKKRGKKTRKKPRNDEEE